FKRISSRGASRSASPVQKLTNTSRLALARNELLLVAQCDQPSLAAESAHLPHVIDIHQRVPVNASKAGMSQPMLQYFQRLGRQVFSLRGEDPDQVAIRLEGVDLVRAQQKVFLTDLTYDPSCSRA